MEAEKQTGQFHYMIPASILAGAILISGSLIYAIGLSHPGGQPAVGSGVPAGGDANVAAALRQGSSRDVILGDPKAPVTLIEYGDYQCPFCAKFFNETEPTLRDQYVKTGKLKMVFRNLMVNDRTADNHESHWSAEAAECAKDQGKFWEYHDAIYAAESKDGVENNGNLNRALFLSIASKLKMDAGKFTSCFDSRRYASAVQAESDGAAKLGASGTPTLFIDSQKVEGAYPLAYFTQIIDAELATKK